MNGWEGVSELVTQGINHERNKFGSQEVFLKASRLLPPPSSFLLLLLLFKQVSPSETKIVREREHYLNLYIFD